MGRGADGHGVQSRPGEVAHRSAPGRRRDQGQGAGPEGFRQAYGPFVQARQRPGAGEVSHVGDQGIEPRPALGLEQSGHGQRIAGVGGEPIDRFRRQEHQLAGSQGG